ncbi:hypothetical protein ABID22_002926 [Pontibacter aydingkolensis]|uniref:Uncharacterized protein n=1 Tax=Pontibacter aydingkolensis TaxID=1911536 RepID=A0ABS7CXC5_9BACT|nr:hypothetical protein [Pontibacter aydingkolensis]MBW7468509.1 hypothetical protein [Pontibacter aydingkolensis]
MRDNREMNYGSYSQQYSQGQRDSGPYQGRRHAYLGDTQHEPGQDYRRQQSREYGRRGGEVGMRDERYEQMYDISNYTAQPRSEEYGLPRSAENDLDTMGHFPRAGEGPYAGQQRHYSYNMGYNPNYDNPEEGDMYRSMDSRGNHGYRHDASYGNEDAFRDFEDDRYGIGERVNRVGDRYYGHFGR